MESHPTRFCILDCGSGLIVDTTVLNFDDDNVPKLTESGHTLFRLETNISAALLPQHRPVFTLMSCTHFGSRWDYDDAVCLDTTVPGTVVVERYSNFTDGGARECVLQHIQW